jgi:hypothetical protein
LVLSQVENEKFVRKMTAVAVAGWASPPKMIQIQPFLTDWFCGKCMTYPMKKTVKQPGDDRI